MVKIPKSNSGVIQGILAYRKDELVGSGWVIYSEYYCREVTLVALDGGALEEGIYTIVPSIETFIVVLNRSVH